MTVERQTSEIQRPPFDELQEKLNEGRQNAIKMIRAWSVAEEIFTTGTSAEFGEMISNYNIDHSNMINRMPSSENSGYG